MTERSDKSAEAFRTISEVAKELNLATHVLRFWESKFPQIKPLKRAGGRRYYRPDDVSLLRRLQVLLHEEGYTIKGVQKLFREEGARKFIDQGTAQPVQESAKAPQASLFDTPDSKPTPPVEPNLSPDFSNLLPDVPEPEEVLDPSIPSIEQPPIKQGMSTQQKEKIQAILTELQDLKKCLEAVA